MPFQMSHFVVVYCTKSRSRIRKQNSYFLILLPSQNLLDLAAGTGVDMTEANAYEKRKAALASKKNIDNAFRWFEHRGLVGEERLKLLTEIGILRRERDSLMGERRKRSAQRAARETARSTPAGVQAPPIPASRMGRPALCPTRAPQLVGTRW